MILTNLVTENKFDKNKKNGAHPILQLSNELKLI